MAAGIPDAAYKSLAGDDKGIAASLKRANALERKGQGVLGFEPPSYGEIAERFAAIDAVEDSDWTGVAEKQRRWSTVIHGESYGRAQMAADAWCAAFVVDKRADTPRLTTAFVRQAEMTPTERLDGATLSVIRTAAQRYRFIHLHLAFPHVFDCSDARDAVAASRGERQGFDVVVGNPPWERVKLQEKEFFSSRSPEIADAVNADARRKLIAAADESLQHEFQDALRIAEGESRFLRSSGRFPFCGRGDVNTYSVFTELMRDAISPNGKVGAVVPTGIATDDTTKHFFADLVDNQSLSSLYDFINDSGMFPGVGHGRQKFCLLTLTGSLRPAAAAQFIFFAQTVADLADNSRIFSLTPSDFRLLNPNTRTCPVFRSGRDALITTAAYQRVGTFINEGEAGGNPWQAGFQRMIDMSGDSGRFRTTAELEASGYSRHGNAFEYGTSRYLPLYEAKMLHHFTHRWGDYNMRRVGSQDTELPEVPVELLQDPSWLPSPRYWVAESDVAERFTGDWVIGWRKTARATDVRTIIAAAGPRAAYGDKFQLILNAVDAVSLLACLSSVALDYLARQKLGGTDVSYFIFKQLPVPKPGEFNSSAPWDSTRTCSAWISPRVMELTYTAWDLEAFAHSAHWQGPPFRWDDTRRSIILAELDACFLHLYGIDRDAAEYILGTFVIVNRKDMARFGEERTRRLILERYDALAESTASGEPYQTILDPAPAHPSLTHSESTRPDWAVPLAKTP